MPYTYSVVTDFINASFVDLDQLTGLINANTTIGDNCDYISMVGDLVTIFFLVTLSPTQEAALTAVVNAYAFILSPAPKVSSTASAVVATSGGDYTSIAAAFAAGELSVYIKNGVYYETQDIIISNFGQLRGESTGGVTIVLMSGNSIKSDGSGGVIETAGNISIANNTTAVTGVGTTFTNLAAGRFILIGTNYHTIASVQSNTALTIVTPYKGSAIVNVAYAAGVMNTGVIIQNMIITSPNSATAGNGIYLRSVRHSIVSDVVVVNNNTNINMVNCSDLSLSSIITYSGAGTGLRLVNCVSMSLNTISVFNNAEHGVTMDNCIDTILSVCASENNMMNGYHIVNGCINTKLTECTAKYNNGNGMYSDMSPTNTAVTTCSISNNTGIGLTITGVHDVISNNVVTNNGGIGVEVGESAIVTSNQILSCGGDGISILPGSIDSCVSNNRIDAVGGLGIQIDAAGCIVSNNVITNSISDGIYVNAVDTTVIGNTIKTSGGAGIRLLATASDAVVSSNRATANTGAGVFITAGATANNISLNILKNNTGASLTDGGTGTVLTGNIV